MWSPSSQRAWIEISTRSRRFQAPCVALLAEGVDRNSLFMTLWLSKPVALLAEGVDRNCTDFECMEIISHVALLAEGVDRNLRILWRPLLPVRRPPRRGRG